MFIAPMGCPNFSRSYALTADEKGKGFTNNLLNNDL